MIEPVEKMSWATKNRNGGEGDKAEIEYQNRETRN